MPGSWARLGAEAHSIRKPRANVNTTRLLFAALCLGLACDRARADWRLEAETGGEYESNLSNSDRAADEKADWAWLFHAAVANGWQVSRDLRLNLSADLRSQVWARFDALDTVGGGALATLRYRFGLGREAPWIALEERFGYDRYRDTAWSNWNESARLRGGIGLSQRLAFEAGYEFENRAAPDNFYDLQGHIIDARLIADLTPSWQVALGYSYREGDVLSFAVPSRPDIFSIAQVRPGVPIFGTNPLYNGYRLRGRTHTLSAMAGYRLTRYLSLQFGYEYAVTVRDPLRYDNHRVQAQLAFAY